MMRLMRSYIQVDVWFVQQDEDEAYTIHGHSTCLKHWKYIKVLQNTQTTFHGISKDQNIDQFHTWLTHLNQWSSSCYVILWLTRCIPMSKFEYIIIYISRQTELRTCCMLPLLSNTTAWFYLSTNAVQLKAIHKIKSFPTHY